MTHPPWILLRGLTREARHWGEFPALLASASGTAATCLDLPGNGRRNREPTPLSVAALADFCHAEVERLGTGRPCRVLAMSLGAMVAVEWAARYPGDIAAMALVNTSLRPPSPFHQRLRPSAYPALARLFLPWTSDQVIESTVFGLTVRRAGPAASVIADWRRWRRENPVSRRNALRQLLAAASYRAPRQAPQVPVLLLAGAGDRLVDPRCSATLARRWLLPLAVHPEAGHDLPLDDPSWVLRQLAGWAPAAFPGERATGA